MQPEIIQVPGACFIFVQNTETLAETLHSWDFVPPPLSFELERFNMHGDVMMVVDHAQSLTKTRHHVCSFSPSRILVEENTLTASL
jgi:hypothetical protein